MRGLFNVNQVDPLKLTQQESGHGFSSSRARIALIRSGSLLTTRSSASARSGDGVSTWIRWRCRRFLHEYQSQLRTFEEKHEVAPGVLVTRTGGHTPGHSVVRLASGGDRLTFAGDAVFQVGFEHPDWYNGFEHDPEEAARVRVRLLRELAANRKSLVATHLSFPSVCHVAVDGDVFRWVPGPWEY